MLELIQYQTLGDSDLSKMSRYFSIPKTELIEKSYKELIDLKTQMVSETTEREIEEKQVSGNYIHYMQKFWKPMTFMKNWWSEKEIICAAANMGIAERSIVREENLPLGTHRKS